jgi:hypothetical protein
MKQRISTPGNRLYAVCAFLTIFILTSGAISAQMMQKGQNLYGDASFDDFGWAVDLSADGNTMVVGAPETNSNGTSAGLVRVYEYDGLNWIQKGADLIGDAAFDDFGDAVAISSDGNVIAVGAPENNVNGTSAGQVKVFEWNGVAWVQRGIDIYGDNAFDDFGLTIDISGDGSIVAIGAPLDDNNGSSSGSVKIFQWNGVTWSQMGSIIDGVAAFDQAGRGLSLSTDGSTVAIGAYLNDNNGSNSGHVRVFAWDGVNWVQRGSDIDGLNSGDNFGEAVALSADGNSFVAGAPENDDNGTSSGHAVVFDWNGASWVIRGAPIPGAVIFDDFGLDADMSDDGNTIIVGAIFNDDNGTSSGHARVFVWDGLSWNMHETAIIGPVAGDQLGRSTAISKDATVVAVGAPEHDFNGSSSGLAQAFETGLIAAGCVLQCPPNQNLDCTDDTSPANTGMAMIADTCGVTEIGYSDEIIPGICPSNYTILREWYGADDEGDTLFCTQIINVTDTEAPQFTCITSITLQLDQNGEATLDFDEVHNGVTDNCSSTFEFSIGRSEVFGCGDIGTQTVELIVTDECGNEGSCRFDVTVEDNLPPTLFCPGDITVSLDPGLCDQVVWYTDPYATDNCELVLEADFIQSTFNSNNQFAGNMFDLTNLTANPITITSFDGNVNAAAGQPATFEIWSRPGSYVGFENNAAGWTSMGTAVATTAGINQPTPVPIGGLTIQPGQTVGIFFFMSSYPSPGSLRYTNGNNTYNNGDLQLTAGVGKATPAFSGATFAARTWNGNVHYVKAVGAPPVVEQIDNTGFTNGDIFPIGETCLIYMATDNVGNTSTCEFCIIVEDYYNPTRALSCNDHVQVSFDEDCEIALNADQILEGGPYSCYENYEVEVYEGEHPRIRLIPTSPVITYNHNAQTLVVKVIDPVTGNSCWGRVSVEDKLPPRLMCLDTVVGCSADLLPSNLGYPVPEGAEVINTGSATCPVFVFRNFDNCTDVELRYKDWVTQGDCGSGYDRIITRNWTAVDGAGNESQCIQTIIVELGTLRRVGAPCNFDDLDMPSLRCDDMRDDSKDFSSHIVRWFDGCVDDYLVDTTVLNNTGRRLPMDSIGWNFLDRGPYAGHPSPHSIYWDAHPDFLSTCRCWGPNEVVKWFGTGLPIGAAECSNMQYTYKDSRFEIADNNCDAGDVGCYKLLRQWTILDWCTGEIAGHNQVIKVTDDEGPEITYPGRVTVGMDVWSCEGTWDVPAPWIVDNCSNDTRYEVEVLTGNVFVKPNGQWRVTNLAPGEHTAYITAYDCCGNATTVEVILNVVDDAPPVAVCEAHTVVSIPGGQDPNNAFAKIFAETFDDGSHDNCGPVWFKVVRMIKGACDEINGDDDPVVPGYQEYPDDYAKFCCEDVGQTIQVRFLVFDVDPGPGPVNENLLRPNRPLFGRYTECMVEVFVQDKVQPTVVAPPTIVVSCDFWFDINSLTDPNDATFGRVVTNLANREKVKTTDVVCPEWCEPNFKFNYFPPAGLEDKCALYDPVHPEFTYEHLWGFDGYALSSCGVMPIIIVNDQRECGQGRITRTISVPGGTGPVTATQTIFFVDCNKYYINDENCFDFDDEDGVIWPCDVELRECEASTDPDITGRPEIINEDNCSLVAVKYEDWVFDVVPNACFKIIRKWTILDWCQYDPRINLLDGRWEYDQIILVNDAVKPVLFGCEDVTFCDDGAYYDPAVGSCVGRAELMLDSVADCTPYDDLVFEYKIDAFNDGTYDFISSEYTQVVDNNPYADDESNARDASGVYPIGTHRIKWFVEDMCGNLQTCEYLFTVEDCKKPTPYCRTGIITVVMPSTGTIEVWARDLDIGSFDNCPGSLTFAFDSLGNETAREYDCEDLGTIQVEIYVIDANGNYDYCTTTIEIQDPNEHCGNTVQGEISGLISMNDDSPISKTEVRLYNVNNQMLQNMVTTGSGLYSFTDLMVAETYTVEPNRNDDPINGVSTKDLVGIQRHLLGLSEFTDPYQLIAADVNNSGSVTAKDLVELRKLILGIYDSFEEIDADQRSWRFVLKDGGITNPASPWDFKEVKTYEPLTQNRPNTDFVGVKIGDVDGNAAGLGNGTQARTNGALNLIAEDVRYELGDEVRIAVRSDNFDEITGYQYTLHFDAGSLSYAGVESGSIELGDLNFGLNRLSEGTLTTSWHSENGVSSDDVLYTLVFKATSTGRLSESVRLSSSVTRAEAYTVSGETRGVSMSLRSSKAGLVYELHQNQPNPFASETVIGFTLPKAMDASITIYDVTGKVLKYIEVVGDQGYNQVPVRSGDLSASGVLYYQLDTEGFTQTKKMVKVSRVE